MPPPPLPPPLNGAKVTPNLAMDAEGTRLLNLTVLQCFDPNHEADLVRICYPDHEADLEAI
jgi:mRNA-decapping enzyme 1B